jgi:hypothetical protein
MLYKIIWFNQTTVIKEETLEADNKQTALQLAYLKYPVNEAPAPCITIEEVKE